MASVPSPSQASVRSDGRPDSATACPEGGSPARLGVGRVGAIVAPVLAGAALAVVSPAAMYLASAVPLLLAFVAALVLARRTTTPPVAAPAPAPHH